LISDVYSWQASAKN